MISRAILVLILSVSYLAFGDAGNVLLPNWISPRALSTNEVSARYFGESDMTPTVSAEVPNASAFSNTSFRLLLRHREAMVTRSSARAAYGGKMIASYDWRAANRHISDAEMSDEEIRQIWQTNPPLFQISYFRGRIIYKGNPSFSNDWITVFSSEDRRRIVFIRDFGPICFSEDGGLNWNTIHEPGHYECALSTSPKGSVVVAALELRPYTPINPKDETTNEGSWYSVVASAGGGRFVMTGGDTHPAPILAITNSADSIYLSWPSNYTGFALQKNTDLATTNWVDVTNSEKIVGSQFEVILPIIENNRFFRLVHR